MPPGSGGGMSAACSRRPLAVSWAQVRWSPSLVGLGCVRFSSTVAHLAGRERVGEARWDELAPPYQDLAADMG
jgi:hypothetical protein